MILKIYQQSVPIDDDYISFEIEIEDTEIPLLSIFHKPGLGVTFCRHYPGSGLQMMGDDQLPYLLIDGKLEWNVPISAATVKDFLATHPQCFQEGIYAETGYPAAGGPGRILITAAWEILFITLRKHGVDLGFTVEAIGILVSAFLEIRDYFVEKKVRPLQLVDRLSQLREVGKFEIAEQLNIDVSAAVQLLVGLGYKWDEKNGKYFLEENERHIAVNLLGMLAEQEADR